MLTSVIYWLRSASCIRLMQLECVYDYRTISLPLLGQYNGPSSVGASSKCLYGNTAKIKYIFKCKRCVDKIRTSYISDMATYF